MIPLAVIGPFQLLFLLVVVGSVAGIIAFVRASKRKEKENDDILDG